MESPFLGIIIIGPKGNTIHFMVSFPVKMYNRCLFQPDLGCSELSVVLTFNEISPYFDLKVLQILVLISQSPTQAQKCCLAT